MSDRGTRKWVFTVNNYSEDDITQLHNDFLKYGKKYICEKEIGESGTPHLQGFVMFNNSRNLETLKKVNKRAHWDKAKGSIEQNKKYCSKDDNVIFEKDMFEDPIIPLDDKINKIFNFEVINRIKAYEKFIKEVNPNMEGYNDLEKYLRNKIEEGDFIRYKRD